MIEATLPLTNPVQGAARKLFSMLGSLAACVQRRIDSSAAGAKVAIDGQTPAAFSESIQPLGGSRFDDFERDALVAKQFPEALQSLLVTGIDR